MFNLDNEGISFGEEEIKAPGADDISISTDDEKKKEDPAEEPKEEPKKEEAKEEKKVESNFDVETPSDEKKEEPSTENEDEDDLDLSDLFADIEDAKDAGEDSAKILGEVAAAGGTISPDQIKDLEAQLATQKDINTRLSGQVKKLMNDSVDMSYKNAELEAFGWVNTNPNILILSKNLEKAQSGDDKAKSKVVSVLKSLFEEFTGNDFEKDKIDKETDILSATSLYNSNSNPNLKLKKDNEIEWLSI